MRKLVYVVSSSRVRLSDFAVSQGLSYLGCYKLWKAGQIEGIQLGTGTILVNGWKEEVVSQELGMNAVVYARVSSAQNKDSLESQAQHMTDYCTTRGYRVVKVVKETGSGLNDARPKLAKLLNSDEWDVLVVEHKDRLTRFGYPYIELAVTKSGQRIEIVNNSNNNTDTEDLMQDFVAVVTSFCTRLYGLRRSHRKTEQIIKELENPKTAKTELKREVERVGC